VAYGLLGSTWLIMKTEGSLQERAYAITRKLVWVLLAVIVAVSLWTPFIDARIAERWFSLPNLIYLSPVPLLVAGSAYLLLRAVAKKSQVAPFIFTLALIFLCYVGFGISLWPNIIPPDIDIWEASSPPESQGFTLVGTLIIIPVVLGYTIWAYYVFRGKVRATDEFYH
jgi:cytochrome d ubiquinol oxidase subunit II